MKRLITFLPLLIMAACLLSACQGNSNIESNADNANEKVYHIGAMQLVEHPALNAAFAGFKQALKDKHISVKIDLRNAQGDMNNNNLIAKKFVNDNVDLIFANSTPCAQAALNATKEIPIVFTSVSDPVAAKLVTSLNDTHKNITGTTDMHPLSISKTIDFIQQEYPGKTIGMIYNAGEQNSVVQIDLVRRAIKNTSLKLVTATVANSSEVKQAAQSISKRADLIYIITDNTVVSALKAIVSVAEEEKIPLITGELDSLKEGAFAAYGFTYTEIGYQAGLMAAEILTKQKNVAEMLIEPPQKLTLVINKSAASKMDIQLKPQWEKIATYID